MPRRKAVGSAQKGPRAPQMPNAATDSAARAPTSECGSSAAATKPAAPTRAGTATCQRRSPVRSERAPTTTIPRAATTCTPTTAALADEAESQ